MSRLNTQQRLSQGPRDFEVGRSFLVQPERIAAASTQDLSSLLSGMAQVSAQVVVTNNAAKKKQDDEDFQITLNQLATQKEAYERGEIPSSVLLQGYSAATDRFTDPRQQAQLIQFGELFKTRLVEEAKNKQIASAQGWIDNQVTEVVNVLQRDEEYLKSAEQKSYVEQLASNREELFNTLPPEVLKTIESDDALRARFQQHLLTLTATTHRVHTDWMSREMDKVNRYAVDKGITDILEGADVASTFSILTTKQGIPQEEVVTQVAESLVGNIKSAEANGSLPELGRYILTADSVLAEVPTRYGKERSDISAAVSVARQSIGNILSETLGNRVNVARAAGATADEVESAVVGRLLDEAEIVFEQDFPTEQSLLVYQPQNQAERGIHKAMLDAYKSVQEQVEKRSNTVNNAITAMQNPDNALPADIIAPLSFGPEDLTPYLDGLQETVDNPNTLRVIEAARTDRAALYHLLASVNRKSSGAGAIARAAGREHLSGQTVTEAGLRQVFATLDGLGGPGNTYLVADEDDSKDYALGKAFNNYIASGVVDPDVYNSAYRQVEQQKFKVSGVFKTYPEAILDPNIAERVTGRPGASFDRRTQSVLLQSTNIGGVPEADRISGDSDYIVSTIKKNAKKNGIYFVQDYLQGNERPVYTYTTSDAIPEALGMPHITTESMTSGLNNYLSQADRLVALEMTGGSYKSLWLYALDKSTSLLPDDRAKSAFTISQLLAKKERGEANIVIGVSEAGKTVPIYLSLNEQGQNVRAILLGNINFSKAHIAPILKNFGTEAFKSHLVKERKGGFFGSGARLAPDELNDLVGP